MASFPGYPCGSDEGIPDGSTVTGLWGRSPIYPSCRTMKTAVAIRHVCFEDLGNFEPILMADGYRIEYRETGQDDLSSIGDGVDLLIVLGGPIGVYEQTAYPFLRQEITLVEGRLKKDQPTLGICLGAQIMARALGARVYPGSGKEIGWHKLTLTQAGRKSPLNHLAGAKVLHWHGDTFETPPGALLLASTSAYTNQAFSWGQRGLAVQFHPEVKLSTLERWYIGHACELATIRQLSVVSLRNDARRFAPVLQPRGERLWKDWLSAIRD